MFRVSRRQNPTRRECESFRVAFAEEPWCEHYSKKEAKTVCRDLRAFGAFVLQTYESRWRRKPYLYTHGKRHDDINQLVAEQFEGEGSFYEAVNPDVIRQALNNLDNVCFISNIHADRKVRIAQHLKPRLQLFPDVIDECFAQSQAQAVAFFTHQETAVYKQTHEQLMAVYDINEVPYDVRQTEGSNIESLVLFVITKPEPVTA